MIEKNSSRTGASSAWKMRASASLTTLVALAALLTGCAVTQEGTNESTSNVGDVSEPLAAKADLTVSLSVQRQNFRASDAQTLTFRITNTSAASQRVLKWATPLSGIEHPIFAVSSPSGRVGYIGPLAKRSAPQESDYVVLTPGQTLSAQVDLSTAYDVHEVGQYTVEYIGGSLPAARSAAAKGSAAPTYSGTSTSFHLDEARASKLASNPQAGLAKGTSTYDPACSTAQRTAIDSALSNAELMATRAYTAISATIAANRPLSTWYSEWFGAYDSGRYSTVTTHYQNLKNTVAGQNFQFTCNVSGCSPSWYAFVSASNPYVVNLCSQFFSAPQVGTDSKAGTIIHETSHFTVVAGTSDFAYGQTNARSLAISNPAQAISNADSHEYFAEGSLGRGFMILSDGNSGLAVNAYGGATDGAELKLVNNCSINNPDCTWTFRNGMIVSDRDPHLAINAWGGAAELTTLRLSRNCTASNSDCSWTLKNGMFVSNSDTSLRMNAYGGAVHGASLKLTSACVASNTDCTFTESGIMLTSDANPQLAVNAYGGATHGANLVLAINCTSNNNDCLWNYTKGMLYSRANTSLAVNAYGGAADGAQLKVVNNCTASNPDCTFTYQFGHFLSAASWLEINAWGGAVNATALRISSHCTLSNPDCMFSGDTIN